MSRFDVPYGDGTLSLQVPAGMPCHVLLPRGVPGVPDPMAEVVRALDDPLGGVRLEDFRRAQRAVIVVNDKTRPIPNAILLPPLLERLERLGLEPHQITFLIATGSHLPMTPEEFLKVLSPQVLNRYRVLSHDAREEDNLVHLGYTSWDNPVMIHRLYVEADLRIIIGNIEPHQLAGFSGTVKSVVIGLGSLPFITQNHSRMGDPHARPGVYEGNPIREEMEEAGRLAGVDFALNTLINGQGEIVRVLAGTAEAVQKAGVALSSQVHFVEAPEEADIVISSPGGYPKDINLYQAQKALAHACGVVKDGGTVILVAECREGSGSRRFEEWMDAASSPEDIRQRFRREGFPSGYHKAFQFARDMAKAHVILVSSLDPEIARRWFFTPAPSLDAALAMALERHGPEAVLAIMPKATSTVVRVRRR